jgi:DNA polymerase I
VWCTQLGEYVIGGNRWKWEQLGLAASAERRLPGKPGKDAVVSAMIRDAGLCTTEIPESWLRRYCVQDVRVCHELFLEQRRYMLEEDPRLLPIQYTRCLLVPVLADIEKNGMHLDSEQVETLAETKEREIAAVEQEMEKLTGGINFNSGKQIAKFLYEDLGFEPPRDRRGNPIVTPKGAPKTDTDTLMLLNARTKLQQQFLDLYRQARGLHNELTKYLRKFRDCCSEVGGHLRAEFNQTNTATHRLSSSGLDYSCQFQNFPGAYKSLFRARNDGWLVGEADGAQLEFRIAAHLGRDDVALADILSGGDIHAVTAGVIGCTRDDAKPHTFKPLYGGRSGTPEQRRYYEFFREKYRGITDTQQSWINAVLADKKLTTEWGLTYYWPNCRMERSGYITETQAICNYPVQGFATAEIIPIGLVYFWHYIHAMRPEGVQMFLVNTIHDSVISELPREEVPLWHELAQRCLIEEVYTYLRCMYNVDLTVPLGAGVLVGERWNDAEAKEGETKYTAPAVMYEQLKEAGYGTSIR